MDETLYVDSVLKKAEALKRAGLWMPEPRVRPAAWVNNFEPSERAVAAFIVDNLLYYSNSLTNALFSSAHQNLVDLATSAGAPLEGAYITCVEGEEPSPTDSGHTFCRKARYLLKVPEDRVQDPAIALEKCVSERKPVVFVDDFMGTGSQLISTLERNYLHNSSRRTFRDAMKQGQLTAYYVVLVATELGLQNAALDCPEITIVPCHVLGEEYSIKRMAEAQVSQQIADLPNRLHMLLGKYAPKLQLNEIMRKSDYSLYGWHGLGLTVCFEHGCPDATLPIVWATDGPGWTPLVEIAS